MKKKYLENIDEKIIWMMGAVFLCIFLIPATKIAQSEEEWIQNNSMAYSIDFDYESSDTSRIELSSMNTFEGNTDMIENEKYKQNLSDKNAVLVKNMGRLTINLLTINKTGNTEFIKDSMYYGLNSALAVMRNSEAYVKETNFITNAIGATAAFSTGKESLIEISNSKINTKSDYSTGLSTSYEGKIKISNSNIITAGKYSEQICTSGDVEVQSLNGVSKKSKIAIVKEDGSLDISTSKFSGTSDKCAIEMFRNKKEGMSRLNVIDTSLENKVKSKTFFDIHNTDAEIFLTNTTLKGKYSSLFEIKKSNAKLTTMNQKMSGDIRIDKKSFLEMVLLDKSYFKGSISNPCVSISIDKKSTWELTRDAYVAVLDDKREDFSNIKTNGHNIYYDKDNISNSWLDGKTICLSNGGKIIPMKKNNIEKKK